MSFVKQLPSKTAACGCCGGPIFTHRPRGKNGKAFKMRCHLCYLSSCAVDGSNPRWRCPRLAAGAAEAKS